MPPPDPTAILSPDETFAQPSYRRRPVSRRVGGLATVVSLETPDIASSGRLRKGLLMGED